MTPTDEELRALMPPRCGICGEPMPPGEEMFKFHGYSGPCPKPPLVKDTLQSRLRGAWGRLNPLIEDPVGITKASALLAEAAAAIDAYEAERAAYSAATAEAAPQEPTDARAKALEEAAKICDQIARPEGKRHPTKGYYVDDGVGCADAIRAAITGKAAKREA
jgi:hypothetical protein